MGADLYLLAKRKGNNQITGFATDLNVGYFRDSYNDSSLFWKFELSWWQDYGDLLNKKGNLSPKNAVKVLELLKNNEKVFEANLEKCSPDDKKYFIKKYETLKSFLNEAINLKSEIESSI